MVTDNKGTNPQELESISAMLDGGYGTPIHRVMKMLDLGSFGEIKLQCTQHRATRLLKARDSERQVVGYFEDPTSI